MSLSTTNRSTNLDQVHLSSLERCSVEHFITQYIQTRNIEPTDDARQHLLAALEDYPRVVRVTLYELNAWLDKRLGLKAKHPERLDIITRVDHVLARLSGL